MEASSAYEVGYAVGKYGIYAVLGLLALGGGIFFIVGLVKALTKKTRGWIVATVISGVLALFGVVGLIGVAVNSIAQLAKNGAKSAGTKKTLDSPDGRFHVEVPGNWRAMPELHEEAEIEAGNSFAEQYVIVIENLKTDYVGTLADFDELVIGQMKGNLPGVEVSEPESRPVGSYPALHRRLAATVDHIRVVYFVASIETETGFYQVLTWTMRSREAEAGPALKAVVDSFTSQDGPPTPKPPPPGPGATIHDRVMWIVTSQLGLDPNKVTPESRFVEDLGADSLDTVELVMAAEEEFGVAISDEVAEKLVTVGDLVRWLEKPPVEVE